MTEIKKGIPRRSIVKAVNTLLSSERAESGDNTRGQMLSFNGKTIISWEANPHLEYPKQADIPKKITEVRTPDIPITDSRRVRVILRSGTRHYVFLKPDADFTKYLEHVGNMAQTPFEFYLIHDDTPLLISINPPELIS